MTGCIGPAKLADFVPTFSPTGAHGEGQLQTLVNGTLTKKCTKVLSLVGFPCRYIDVTVALTRDGTPPLYSYEAKVGRGGRSGFTLAQIAKDKALRDAGDVDGVEWHFFASSLSGKIGPSDTVLKALKDAGIPFYVHFPRSI
jgi:hypothetical protein